MASPRELQVRVRFLFEDPSPQLAQIKTKFGTAIGTVVDQQSLRQAQTAIGQVAVSASEAANKVARSVGQMTQSVVASERDVIRILGAHGETLRELERGTERVTQARKRMSSAAQPPGGGPPTAGGGGPLPPAGGPDPGREALEKRLRAIQTEIELKTKAGQIEGVYQTAINRTITAFNRYIQAGGMMTDQDNKILQLRGQQAIQAGMQATRTQQEIESLQQFNELQRTATRFRESALTLQARQTQGLPSVRQRDIAAGDFAKLQQAATALGVSLDDPATRGTLRLTESMVALGRQAVETSSRMTGFLGVVSRLIGGDVSVERLFRWSIGWTVAFQGINLVFRAISMLTVGAIQRLVDFQRQQIALASEFINLNPALPFNQAAEAAGRFLNALIRLQPGFVGTQAQLREILVGAVRYFGTIDLSSEIARKNFITVANAVILSTQGILRQGQALQELRAISEGVVRPGAQLLTILQRQDPQIRQHLELWRAQGTVIQNIAGLLQGYRAGIEHIGNTLAGQLARLQANLDFMLRSVGQLEGGPLVFIVRQVNTLLGAFGGAAGPAIGTTAILGGLLALLLRIKAVTAFFGVANPLVLVLRIVGITLLEELIRNILALRKAGESALVFQVRITRREEILEAAKAFQSFNEAVELFRVGTVDVEEFQRALQSLFQTGAMGPGAMLVGLREVAATLRERAVTERDPESRQRALQAEERVQELLRQTQKQQEQFDRERIDRRLRDLDRLISIEDSFPRRLELIQQRLRLLYERQVTDERKIAAERARLNNEDLVRQDLYQKRIVEVSLAIAEAHGKQAEARRKLLESTQRAERAREMFETPETIAPADPGAALDALAAANRRVVDLEAQRAKLIAQNKQATLEYANADRELAEAEQRLTSTLDEQKQTFEDIRTVIRGLLQDLRDVGIETVQALSGIRITILEQIGEESRRALERTGGPNEAQVRRFFESQRALQEQIHRERMAQFAEELYLQRRLAEQQGNPLLAVREELRLRAQLSQTLLQERAALTALIDQERQEALEAARRTVQERQQRLERQLEQLRDLQTRGLLRPEEVMAHAPFAGVVAQQERALRLAQLRGQILGTPQGQLQETAEQETAFRRRLIEGIRSQQRLGLVDVPATEREIQILIKEIDVIQQAVLDYGRTRDEAMAKGQVRLNELNIQIAENAKRIQALGATFTALAQQYLKDWIDKANQVAAHLGGPWAQQVQEIMARVGREAGQRLFQNLIAELKTLHIDFTISGGAAVPSKQAGGPILQTGIYQLHAGETVLPANRKVGAGEFAEQPRILQILQGIFGALTGQPTGERRTDIGSLLLGIGLGLPALASFLMQGRNLGRLFHGGPEAITRIDPTRLQLRDPGFYGRGFYMTPRPEEAKIYGNIVSQFEALPNAKILNVAKAPDEADPKLFAAIVQFMRGQQHLNFSEQTQWFHGVPASNVWIKGVNEFAQANKFDIIRWTGRGNVEIVIKNPEAIRALGVMAGGPDRLAAMLSIAKTLPTKQFGGPVGETGPYTLHRGEFVLSRDMLANLRNTTSSVTYNLNGIDVTGRLSDGAKAEIRAIMRSEVPNTILTPNSERIAARALEKGYSGAL